LNAARCVVDPDARDCGTWQRLPRRGLTQVRTHVADASTAAGLCIEQLAGESAISLAKGRVFKVFRFKPWFEMAGDE
jgi:hypothetical protein